MKGFVDKDTCVGCGVCTAICPEIFKMGDDGIAEASENEISDNLIESAKDAQEQCPVSAITVE
ncbi:MAG TPA: ferredoxin [Clostridium sp.]